MADRPSLLRVALNAFGLTSTPADLIPEEDRTGMHGPSAVEKPGAPDAQRQIDLNDRAAQAEELARPELIGVRAFWDQSIAAGLTPERMSTVLYQAIRGDHRYFLALAEEMEERDPHYYAVLSMRKRAIARLSAVVEPASESAEDKKIADAVRALTSTPEFRAMLRDLVDSYGKGFSVVELIWGEKDGLWQPAYVWRDPKYFTFDFLSRSEVRLNVMGTIDGERLAAGKWIVHAPKLKSGIPIRGGFARLAAWAWMFKTYTVKDWMAFLDVFGMPIRVGKYHPAATPDDRRKLLQAVSAIAVDAAAIIPETMQIEFIESKANADKPFESMGKYMDAQMSKAILGQTMTTDEGGSLAQAKIHNAVRIDILEDDGDQMASIINRHLIEPFVVVNFGADKPRPAVKFPVSEPEDVAALVNALSALVPLGLEISMREARERIGFSEPDKAEKLLGAAAGANPQKPLTPSQLDRAWNRALGSFPCGCQKTALNAEGVGEAGDEVETLAETAAEDWEPLVNPVVAQILAAAARSKSYEEFAAALDGLAGKVDVNKLTQSLAIAGLKARGLGDVGMGRT